MNATQAIAELDTFRQAEHAVWRINTPLPSEIHAGIKKAAEEYAALMMLRHSPEDFARSGTFGWYSHNAKLCFFKHAVRAIRYHNKETLENHLQAVERWARYEDVGTEMHRRITEEIKAEEATLLICRNQSDQRDSQKRLDQLYSAQETVRLAAGIKKPKYEK